MFISTHFRKTMITSANRKLNNNTPTLCLLLSAIITHTCWETCKRIVRSLCVTFVFKLNFAHVWFRTRCAFVFRHESVCVFTRGSAKSLIVWAFCDRCGLRLNLQRLSLERARRRTQITICQLKRNRVGANAHCNRNCNHYNKQIKLKVSRVNKQA